MEVVGTLKVKFDTQKVSERFTKREFVVTTEANTPYPQHVSFQITQDKCSTLDQFNEGDELRIQFNLRGREWVNPQGETRYFNSIQGWRIERLAAEAPAQQAPPMPAAQAFAPAVNLNEEEADDLPF